MSDTENSNANPHALAAWLWAAGYVVAVFATSALARLVGLEGYWASASLLLPMLLLFPMVRAKGRSAVAQGDASPALLSFNMLATAIIVAFVISMITVSALIREQQPQGTALVLLALVPAVPLLAMLWSVVRYFHVEQDEYLRQRYFNAALIATGVTFAGVIVWGFLETFAGAPRVPILALVPTWCIVLGIANAALRAPA